MSVRDFGGRPGGGVALSEEEINNLRFENNHPRNEGIEAWC